MKYRDLIKKIEGADGCTNQQEAATCSSVTQLDRGR